MGLPWSTMDRHPPRATYDATTRAAPRGTGSAHASPGPPDLAATFGTASTPRLHTLTTTYIDPLSRSSFRPGGQQKWVPGSGSPCVGSAWGSDCHICKPLWLDSPHLPKGGIDPLGALYATEQSGYIDHCPYEVYPPVGSWGSWGDSLKNTVEVPMLDPHFDPHVWGGRGDRRRDGSSYEEGPPCAGSPSRREGGPSDQLGLL